MSSGNGTGPGRITVKHPMIEREAPAANDGVVRSLMVSRRGLRGAVAFSILALCTGCATTTTKGSWGGAAHWPTGQDLKHAAGRALKDPHTWAPLAGAALLAIGDADDSLSRWAADKTPLFGSDAEDASDTLRAVSRGAYLVTALAAPRPSLPDKLKGLAVGAGAVTLNREITVAMKSLVGRERPNGQNDKSFPSGHASESSTAATLAVRNLAYLPLPDWADGTLTVGFYAIAGGTAWARVEAEQHHVSDVLVGYSLGHFIATFMHEAFLEAGVEQVLVGFTPMGGGGALTVRLPLFRVD